jgi:hypothetical protein
MATRSDGELEMARLRIIGLFMVLPQLLPAVFADSATHQIDFKPVGRQAVLVDREMSIVDARKFVRGMGSYARVGYGDATIDGIGIAAVHITPSRMKLDLNGGTVIELPLKDLPLWVYCARHSCVIVLGGKPDMRHKNWTEVSFLLVKTNASPATPDDFSHLTDALLKLKEAALGSPERDARFAEVVRVYRAAATKPPLPEEVRRLRVQAEGAIRDKDFDEAAELYEQGLTLAPWWPEGHFNRALVLSETYEFSDAIAEMKRYLALVPDAPDARAAQDKIYDWERKAGTTN